MENRSTCPEIGFFGKAAKTGCANRAGPRRHCEIVKPQLIPGVTSMEICVSDDRLKRAAIAFHPLMSLQSPPDAALLPVVAGSRLQRPLRTAGPCDGGDLGSWCRDWCPWASSGSRFAPHMEFRHCRNRPRGDAEKGKASAKELGRPMSTSILPSIDCPATLQRMGGARALLRNRPLAAMLLGATWCPVFAARREVPSLVVVPPDQIQLSAFSSCHFWRPLDLRPTRRQRQLIPKTPLPSVSLITIRRCSRHLFFPLEELRWLRAL